LTHAGFILQEVSAKDEELITIKERFEGFAFEAFLKLTHTHKQRIREDKCEAWLQLLCKTKMKQPIL